MLHTLTLNPMIEWVFPVKSHPAGENLRISGSIPQFTGKGVNVARVLTALGVPVCALFPASGSLQKWGQELLHKDGVPFKTIKSPTDLRAGFLIVDAEGNRQSFYEEGHRWASEDTETLRHNLAQIWRKSRPEAVVLAGSLPPGMDTQIYAQLTKCLNELRIPAILDAVGGTLIGALQASPHMVKVNRKEYESTFGKSLESEEDYADALRNLSHDYTISVTVITAGSGAAYFCLEERVVRAFPPEIRSRNGVGSGDSLLAGWLAARQEGNDILPSIRRAMAAGAANAEQLGVASVDPDRVRQLEEKILLNEVL